MTTRCGGGTSGVKTGVGQEVVFSAALITEGLGIISPWLLPVAGLIDSFVYQALTQCASDPPAMPSSADLNPINALGGTLNPNFNSWLTAVNNLLLNWAWAEYCTCTSGTLTLPAYPTQPTTLTVPTPNGSAPCASGTANGTCWQFSVSHLWDANIFSLCPPGQSASVAAVPGFPVQLITPPVPTSVNGSVTINILSAESHQVRFRFTWIDASGNAISSTQNDFVTSTPGTYTQQFTYGVPSNTAYVWISCYEITTVTTRSTYEITDNWLCGSTNSIDLPSLELLNNIYSLLQAVYASCVRKITAFTDGTAHAGLSGNGSFALATDTVAARIHLTATPTWQGEESGTPVALFDVGWLTPLYGSYPYANTRIKYDNEVVVFSAPSDELAYTLKPGIVATITEMKSA